MNLPSTETTCIICGNKIDKTPFARIVSGNTSILLCSPKCALAYFNGSHKANGSSGPSHQADSFARDPSWYDLDASFSGQNQK